MATTTWRARRGLPVGQAELEAAPAAAARPVTRVSSTSRRELAAGTTGRRRRRCPAAPAGRSSAYGRPVGRQNASSVCAAVRVGQVGGEALRLQEHAARHARPPQAASAGRTAGSSRPAARRCAATRQPVRPRPDDGHVRRCRSCSIPPCGGTAAVGSVVARPRPAGCRCRGPAGNEARPRRVAARSWPAGPCGRGG